MDPTDAILLTIEAAGGIVSGRTAIQKLVYFESCIIDAGVAYYPYYYGPYSAEVAGATQSLVSLNFLNEEIDYKESRRFSGSEDWKKYKYKVSDDGKVVLDSIREKYETEYQSIKTIVDICNRVTEMDIHALACAAKVHYITRNYTHPDKSELSFDDIPLLSEEFGWELSDDDMIGALTLIDALKAEMPQI